MNRRCLRFCILTAFCFVLFACPDPHSTIADLYYVSPSGNDSFPGTLEMPFATFAKACSVAGPGDTVFVRGGTYRERLVITASGNGDARSCSPRIRARFRSSTENTSRYRTTGAVS